MNAASFAVLAIVLALAAFAAWRSHRKGMPCACGCEKGSCGCGDGKCHCCK